MKKVIEKFNQYAHHLIALMTLGNRLMLAAIFIPAGWGKLTHLGNTIDFFTSLGIPLPQIQAPMVAGVEFLGGLLLAMGLMTRATALPLIATMIVATMTTKWPDMKRALELLDATELLYAVMLAWVFVVGPGVFSIDRVISKKLAV